MGEAMDLNTIKSDITNTFFTDFTAYALPQDNYTDFAYPKFINMFNKFEGITPLQYRKKYGKIL